MKHKIQNQFDILIGESANYSFKFLFIFVFS